MIRHHQGGVAMAGAATKMATRREVTRLARSMVLAQSYEIRMMSSMLQARRAALVILGALFMAVVVMPRH